MGHGHARLYNTELAEINHMAHAKAVDVNGLIINSTSCVWVWNRYTQRGSAVI